MTSSQHVYEVRPRKDKRDFDLISDALPFGGLWYCESTDAIEYAKFYSRSHHAVIRVYDEAGHIIQTYEHAGDGKRTICSTEPAPARQRSGISTTTFTSAPPLARLCRVLGA